MLQPQIRLAAISRRWRFLGLDGMEPDPQLAPGGPSYLHSGALAPWYRSVSGLFLDAPAAGRMRTLHCMALRRITFQGQEGFKIQGLGLRAPDGCAADLRTARSIYLSDLCWKKQVDAHVRTCPVVDSSLSPVHGVSVITTTRRFRFVRSSSFFMK